MEIKKTTGSQIASTSPLLKKVDELSKEIKDKVEIKGKEEKELDLKAVKEFAKKASGKVSYAGTTKPSYGSSVKPSYGGGISYSPVYIPKEDLFKARLVTIGTAAAAGITGLATGGLVGLGVGLIVGGIIGSSMARGIWGVPVESQKK